MRRTGGRAEVDSQAHGTDALLECIKRSVGSIQNRFATTCSETADGLSRYLEHDLAFPRRRRVARHLRRCIRCQSLLHSLAWTIEQLRTLGASEVMAPSVAEAVSERIRTESANRSS